MQRVTRPGFQGSSGVMKIFTAVTLCLTLTDPSGHIPFSWYVAETTLDFLLLWISPEGRFAGGL